MDVKDVRLVNFDLLICVLFLKDVYKVFLLIWCVFVNRVVVNYDFFIGIEDYVYWIGRIGCVGVIGLVFIFFFENDGKYVKFFIKILEEVK